MTTLYYSLTTLWKLSASKVLLMMILKGFLEDDVAIDDGLLLQLVTITMWL